MKEQACLICGRVITSQYGTENMRRHGEACERKQREDEARRERGLSSIVKIDRARFYGPRGVLFTGTRGADGLAGRVRINENGERRERRELELPPRLDLANHSPTGFEWGYGGSGPAQLALAVAAYCLGDERGEAVYQELKWGFFAVLSQEPGSMWEIWSEDVVAFADILETAGNVAANKFLNSLVSRECSQGGL